MTRNRNIQRVLLKPMATDSFFLISNMCIKLCGRFQILQDLFMIIHKSVHIRKLKHPLASLELNWKKYQNEHSYLLLQNLNRTISCNLCKFSVIWTMEFFSAAIGAKRPLGIHRLISNILWDVSNHIMINHKRIFIIKSSIIL